MISAKSQPQPDLCSMLGCKQYLRGFLCVCLPKGQGAGRVYLPLFSHQLHSLGLEDVLGVEIPSGKDLWTPSTSLGSRSPKPGGLLMETLQQKSQEVRAELA